jgi:hypothetical protein
MDAAEAARPEIAELRNKLLDGLIPIGDFAAAIGKHAKTLMRLGPPIVRVGRAVYVPEGQGRAWLLNGCKPIEPDRQRNRGQRRAA